MNNLKRKKIKIEFVDITGIINKLDCKVCSGCPFNFISEEHEMIQNHGCLPDHNHVIEMYLNNEGHWKCHSRDIKCTGLSKALELLEIKANNEDLLITEDNPLVNKK